MISSQIKNDNICYLKKIPLEVITQQMAPYLKEKDLFSLGCTDKNFFKIIGEVPIEFSCFFTACDEKGKEIKARRISRGTLSDRRLSHHIPKQIKNEIIKYFEKIVSQYHENQLSWLKSPFGGEGKKRMLKFIELFENIKKEYFPPKDILIKIYDLYHLETQIYEQERWNHKSCLLYSIAIGFINLLGIKQEVYYRRSYGHYIPELDFKKTCANLFLFIENLKKFNMNDESIVVEKEELTSRVGFDQKIMLEHIDEIDRFYEYDEGLNPVCDDGLHPI